ncbi:unnamed protein product [Heligmosomoides polygyrus]|uniref:BLOC-1-related complex subunit 7 n=1 Tax=Heligmosomoides polygyrus TaxID=6339 RepID=A0A183FF11_HELPZ|nr:unnamed protein product [Heligmosomoides polygyrus]
MGRSKASRILTELAQYAPIAAMQAKGQSSLTRLAEESVTLTHKDLRAAASELTSTDNWTLLGTTTTTAAPVTVRKPLI